MTTPPDPPAAPTSSPEVVLDLQAAPAEWLARWDACTHPAAAVVASSGPDALPWQVLQPDANATLPDLRYTLALGVCADCGAPVTSLRMADHERWTPEHGPAWSTPWTRLARDGEPRRTTPPASQL